MADQTSGDRPVTTTTGEIEGQQDSTERRDALDDQFAAGADPAVGSRDIRVRTARQRQHTARTRLDAAADRDDAAHARDLAAVDRDQAAATRDVAMTELDDADEQAPGGRALSGAVSGGPGAADRERIAERRALTAEHYALGAQDRQAAEQDREQAAHERLQALVDREALARLVAIIETDALTGARPRAAGLVDLDHELERCSRASDSLVVAHVDVVAPQLLDDSPDHGAGDDLLRHTVAHIHDHLRVYDLIIRLDTSQFLCAMCNMTLPCARERFSSIAAEITAASGADAVVTGYAELMSHETTVELLARADSDRVAALSAQAAAG